MVEDASELSNIVVPAQSTKFPSAADAGGVVEANSAPSTSESSPKAFDWPSVRVWPSAKNLILKHDLDLQNVVATGPKNLILKEDVLKVLQSRQGDKVYPTH